MTDLTVKADSLAKRMNKLTDTLMSNIQVAEDMHIAGQDVIDMVEAQTIDVPLMTTDTGDSHQNLMELINLQNLLSDFKYLRDTLRENTDNGRKILNLSTTEILEGSSSDLGDPEFGGISEAENKVNLINAYATLNRTITDSLKLYVSAYKEISNIILNLEKVKTNQLTNQTNTTNNTLVLNSESKTQSISTNDLIKQLSKLGKQNE